MTSKNLNEPLEGNGIQKLEMVVKELHCHNKMNVEYLLSYPGENDTTLKMLTDE